MTNNEKAINYWRYFSVLVLFVVIVWLGSYYLMNWYFEHPEHSGPAGDTFGAATSLFSGLAFAGLLVTLLMQSNELSLQREQLKIQNIELELQRGELAETREEFKIQRFESRFFGMLKFLNDHVDSMRAEKSPKKIGRQLFSFWVHEVITRNVRNIQRKDHLFSLYRKNYDQTYKEAEEELGPYFRLLYNVFRQIDAQSFSLDDKKSYAAIARAQMSSDELFLLMLNGMSAAGEPFKKWILEYALLEHISITTIEHCKPAIEFYERSAFGDRAHVFFDSSDNTSSPIINP